MSTTTPRTRPAHPWARTERGSMALDVLVGGVLGVLVLGSATALVINADKVGQRTVEKTTVEAAAVQVLNRAGRDIQDSTRVLEAKADELVVEKASGGKTNRKWTRTYYRVEGTGENRTLVSRSDDLTSYTAYDPDAAWTPETTLGRKVEADTRFDYADAEGNVAADEADVSRVDITYVARTARGTVSLKSSAAVKNVSGGGPAAPPVVPDAPGAVNDVVSVIKGGGPVAVDVLANDSCDNGATPCPPSALTVFSVTGQPAGTTATVSGSSITVEVTGAYAGGSGSFPLTYTITDANGTSSATLTVNVTEPAAPPTAADDTVNIVRGGATVTPNVLANDTNAAGGTVTIVGAPPTGVSVGAITGGSVPITVDNSYVGGSLTYQVDNGSGTDTATVTLNVIDAVNDAALSISAGGSGTRDVHANDLGYAPPTVTSIRTTAPSGVTLSLTGGTIEVAANAGYTGTFTVAYRLTAGSVYDEATFSVTVTAAAVPDVTVAAAPAAAPASVDAATGTNNVTWSGGTGPYAVARSLNGGSAWTTINPSVAGTSLTDTVALGTVARYRVTPTTGTAGTDYAIQFPENPTTEATGSDTNGDKVADAVGTNAVTWTTAGLPSFAGDVEATEFPAPGTQFQDGNRLRSYRSKVVAGDTILAEVGSAIDVSLSGAGCPAGLSPCYKASGQTAGTERVYDAVALVTCDPDIDIAIIGGVYSADVDYCMSPNGIHARGLYTDLPPTARAYQAPAAAAQTIVSVGSVNASGVANANDCGVLADGATTQVSAPVQAGVDNRTLHCATNTAKVAFSAVGDDGAAADGKFCAYPANVVAGLCESYAGIGTTTPTVAALLASNTEGIVGNRTDLSGATGATEDNAVLLDPQASPDGATRTIAVTACNPGGCATPVTRTVYSYPGTYGVSHMVQRDYDRAVKYNLWYKSGASWVGETPEDASKMYFAWSPAAGAPSTGNYAWSLTAIDSLTGATSVGNVSEAASTTQSVLPAYADQYAIDGITAPPVGTPEKDLPKRSGGTLTVREGTLYRATVKATGAGSLFRRAQATMFTAPPPVSFVQDSPFCKASVDNGWKYGVRLRKSVHMSSGTADVSAAVTGLRLMLWTGIYARNNGWGTDGADIIGDRASDGWMLGAQDPASWTAPGSWVGSTEYWRNWTITDLDAATFGNYLLGYGDDDRVIPSWNGTANAVGAAHMRVETYIGHAAAGYPDFAILRTWDGAGSDMVGGSADDTTAEVASNSGYRGQAVRARAFKVTDAAVANCVGNGTAANRFDATYTNWTAIADGAQISRRSHPSASAAKGNESPATRRWDSVG